MKSWRRGFMRWRIRDGPWGSHHEEARLLKCATSDALTELYVLEVGSGFELELVLVLCSLLHFGAA